MFPWRKFVLCFAQTGFIPAVTAVGCPNCLGYDKGLITGTCQKACADPKIGFTDHDQIISCQTNCNHFVNDQQCCTTVTCSPDKEVCTRPDRLSSRSIQPDEAALNEIEGIKKDPSLLDFSRLAARDSPYHIIRSTKDLRSLDPISLGHWQVESPETDGLQARSNADVCCLVARGMVYGA